MEFEEEQRLTDEDVGTEEELIDLVKACPILYDVRLKVYKDRNMKDSAWRSISEAMKLSGNVKLTRQFYLQKYDFRLMFVTVTRCWGPFEEKT